jgi:hypothetical protein
MPHWPWVLWPAVVAAIARRLLSSLRAKGGLCRKLRHGHFLPWPFRLQRHVCSAPRHHFVLIPAPSPTNMATERRSFAEDALWYFVLCCVLQGPVLQAWWATRCRATACSATPSTRRHAWSRTACVSTRCPAMTFFVGGGGCLQVALPNWLFFSALRIHVSPTTKEVLDTFETFELELRGDVEMKVTVHWWPGVGRLLLSVVTLPLRLTRSPKWPLRSRCPPEASVRPLLPCQRTRSWFGPAHEENMPAAILPDQRK